MHIRIHDHRMQGLVDPPAAFEQRREERSRAEVEIFRSTSPLVVDIVFDRCPLRCVIRPSVRS